MAKAIKKKFFEISLPIVGEKYESLANSIEDLKGKGVKIDFTRKLKGKSVDLVFSVRIEDGKAVGYPKKLMLMPFFIRHMLHTGIDYVEDSIEAETLDNKVTIKPFLITRKKVSRAVRRTLRNSAKNWLVDYLKTKTSEEVFTEILSNQVQKPLSLKLKKTYPLAICEIRIFEIKAPLNKSKEESKPIGEVEVKREVIESDKDDVKEIKEDIIESIKGKLKPQETEGVLGEEKPKKKASKKKEE